MNMVNDISVDEEVFKNIAENISEVFWVGSPDWRKVYYISPAYEVLWGRSCQSLYNNPLSWFEAIHDDDKKLVEDAIRHKSSIDLTPPEFPEYRIIRPDGSVRWVLARAYPVFSGDGEIIRITGIAEDITQRRLAAIALRKSNRTLKTLIDSNRALVRSETEEELTNSICSVLTEAGGYLMAWVGYANNDTEKSITPMAQKGLEEEYLKNIKISWGDNKYGQGPTGRAIRSGEPIVIQDLMNNPSFAPWREQAVKRGYAASCAMPLKVDQEVIGALNIYAKESDAFNTEEVNLLMQLANDMAYGISSLRARVAKRENLVALRLSENNYKTIFNNVTDAIFVHDRDSGTIIDVNQTVLDLFGYTQEEAKYLSLAKLGSGEPPYSGKEAIAWMQKTLTEGDQSFEWLTRHKNGKLFWVEVNLRLVKISDQQRVLAIVRDIDQRRQAEQDRIELQALLQQSQKMEAIGQLTGGIAHDFNNILASVMGYSSLALDKYLTPEDGKLYEYVNEIHKAGARARDLVSQMLTFSRSSQVETKPMDLSLIVTDVLKMLRPTLPSSLQLETNIDNGLPSIYADPVRLQQLLTNLCINARDAMEGKAGTVKLSLYREHVHEKNCASCHSAINGDYVVLQVSDNGSGIDPFVIQHIFEPFFTTKQVGKGTGMGLSVVHGVLHDINGHILVSSEKDRGTTFKVLLPILAEKNNVLPASQQFESIDKTSKENAKVLIVDDEYAISQLLAELLQMNGYQVAAFTSSMDALQVFEQAPELYDLVITDQTMPFITGIELSKALLNIRPSLPIILCTGYSESVNEEVVKSIGISRLFYKPLDINGLLFNVKALLDSR